MAIAGKSAPCLLIKWHDRDEMAISIVHAQGMLVTALKTRHQERESDNVRYIREVVHRLDLEGSLWIEAIDAQVLRKSGYTVLPGLLLR